MGKPKGLTSRHVGFVLVASDGRFYNFRNHRLYEHFDWTCCMFSSRDSAKVRLDDCRRNKPFGAVTVEIREVEVAPSLAPEAA